jgi:hypothetical protein
MRPTVCLCSARTDSSMLRCSGVGETSHTWSNLATRSMSTSRLGLPAASSEGTRDAQGERTATDPMFGWRSCLRAGRVPRRRSRGAAPTSVGSFGAAMVSTRQAGPEMVRFDQRFDQRFGRRPRYHALLQMEDVFVRTRLRNERSNARASTSTSR